MNVPYHLAVSFLGNIELFLIFWPYQWSCDKYSLTLIMGFTSALLYGQLLEEEVLYGEASLFWKIYLQGRLVLWATWESGSLTFQTGDGLYKAACLIDETI